MAGGIIITRLPKLIETAQHPSFYDSFSAEERADVDAIAAKGPGDYTNEDGRTLARMILNQFHD